MCLTAKWYNKIMVHHVFNLENRNRGEQVLQIYSEENARKINTFKKFNTQ